MARPVLLIAGGSRGIGASTARLAGESGYDVAINYVSNAKAAGEVAEAVKKSGGKSVTIQGDMSKEAEIIRVFDETTKALGPVTHFVHSAGIGGKNSRLDVATAATIREVLDINLFGALICAREAVRRMSTTHGGKGGSISRSAVVDRRRDRRRHRICFLCRSQRRRRCADERTGAGSRAGRRARQRHTARRDRHRNP